MDRKIFFIIVMTTFCAIALTSCKKEEYPEKKPEKKPEEHPVSFTVTFDSNYGSWVQAQNVTSGAKVTEPAPPMRTGYIFLGWYKDSDLT